MEVLRVAILDFCRRTKGRSFSPAEVVRQMFPEDWELFIEDVRDEMTKMYQENLIELSQDGVPLREPAKPGEQALISGLNKPK